jgi:hypothetical protein
MAPDASWAVTVAADGTVQTWGGVAPRVIRRAVAIRSGLPVAVALSDDRVRVLLATGETIRLHENVMGPWPRDQEFRAPAPIRALALSRSAALAVVACDDGTLRTLNTGTGEFGATLATGTVAARAVAVASDRGPVVAAFDDGDVRCYDLAAGTSDLVGRGRGIDLVAVSPDGEAVIAASDAILVRWSRSGRAAPDYQLLSTAVTAIALDDTGGKVLAARDDGTLWLHDMNGGPAVEFTAPAGPSPPAPPPPAPPPPARSAPSSSWWESQPTPPWQDHPQQSIPAEYAPPPALGSVPPADAGGSLVDDDVRFTVYRPQALAPGLWVSLLVFTHKTELVEQPGQPPLDPGKRVEAIARMYFGNTPPPPAGVDARTRLVRGTQLRITVDLPGIRCNPGYAEFEWWEPVHHVEFRLLAGPHLDGSVVRGAVRIWFGPMLIGEVSLAISITTSAPAVQPLMVAESAPRYRKIFPSYSSDDDAIVDGFTEVVHAFGDEYLRDVVSIRSGERWRGRLLELIDEADIFQLFWSRNSMNSQWCREEWEHALALGRPLFVRPCYWEDPRPGDPAMGLPPAALDALEFVKVTLSAARREIPASGGAVPDAAAAAPRADEDSEPTGAYAGVGHQPSLATPYDPAGPPGSWSPGPPPQASAPGRPLGVARRRHLAVAALVLVVLTVIIAFLLAR